MSFSNGSGTVSVRAALDHFLPRESRPQGATVITDIHTYKNVRERIVELFESISLGKILVKEDFDSVYNDLRRTQEYARQVSLPDKNKLQMKDLSNLDVEGHWRNLINMGLIADEDDDKFIKIIIWRQHLRLQPNFIPPSFADIRQWIGMIYTKTLKNMAEETSNYKNSKPRTRSELFLRLFLLGKISGLQLEFHHTDFRS